MVHVQIMIIKVKYFRLLRFRLTFYYLEICTKKCFNLNLIQNATVECISWQHFNLTFVYAFTLLFDTLALTAILRYFFVTCKNRLNRISLCSNLLLLGSN